MKNYQVVLVDNEKRLVQCLELILSIEGYVVTTAESGDAAYKIISEIYGNGKEINLLITDIWMPRMSGLELIDKLVQANITPPILGISGYVDNDIVAKLNSKGCRHLILKPFTTEELLAKITEILEPVTA